MVISSRTPEGRPSRCPVCLAKFRIEPSVHVEDAPCPNCGHLVWFSVEGVLESSTMGGRWQGGRPYSSPGTVGLLSARCPPSLRLLLGRECRRAFVSLTLADSLLLVWFAGFCMVVFRVIVRCLGLPLPTMPGTLTIVLAIVSWSAWLATLFARRTMNPLSKLSRGKSASLGLWDRQLDW